MLLLSMLLPGVEVSSFFAALIFAIVFGIINAIIRPVVIVFTLPLNLITVGLFTFVINALMFWLATVFVIGVSIDGFWTAFWSALIMSLVAWFSNRFIGEERTAESD